MKWSSVDEQLPTFNTIVLIWREGLGFDAGRYCIDRKWYNKAMTQCVTLVTHWCYVPSPKESNYESRFTEFE